MSSSSDSVQDENEEYFNRWVDSN